MSLNKEQEVRDLVQSVIEAENIGNDYKIEIGAGSEPGDGYVSYVTAVDILSPNKNLRLVIKNAPENEQFRQMMCVRHIFLREIYFYEEVFQSYSDFQVEKCIKEPFNNVCKLYKSIKDDSNEKLIMQNIKAEGYKLWNRFVPMDHEHLKFAFETYAKLHGTGYALRAQKPDVYNKLKSNYDTCISYLYQTSFIKGMVQGMMGKIMELFAKESTEIVSRIQTFLDNYEDFISLLSSEGPNFIIGHGDCWCNNLMFKYDECGKPQSVYLLDFQYSSLVSPVQDLSYFFYVSSTKEMQENLDTYLRIYYDAFVKHVKALGSNPDDFFTFDSLKNEWKKYSRFGFVAATLVLKVILQPKEESISLMKNTTEDDLQQTLSQQGSNDDITYARVKDLTKHMFNNGFI